MLRSDVRTAILSHEVMEAANEVVPNGMAGIRSEFFDTYGAVQNALALKLAMDLARIFDVTVSGRFPIAEQDKASIPVLAALLDRSDVREHFICEAAHWFRGVASPGVSREASFEAMWVAVGKVNKERRNKDALACERALDDFAALAVRLRAEGSDEADALGRVRRFRNQRLAHSLFDKEPEKCPRYSDLSMLLKAAMNATELALFAVEGQNADYSEIASEQRRNAKGFSLSLVRGLKLSSARQRHRFRRYRIQPGQ